MTATIRKFCCINGIDINSEELPEIIFSALTGDLNGRTGNDCDEAEEIKASISNGVARTADR